MANRGFVTRELVHSLAETRKQEAGALKHAFSELARQRSDDATSKPVAGDLGFKTREELAQQWGQEVAEAAFGIANQGDMTQVESARGVHLLKLTGRQPGLDRPFEAARTVLESRVKMEKRSQATEDLVAQLRTRSEVKIDAKELEAVKVDAQASGGPTPPPVAGN